MLVKIHKSYRDVVAVCDNSLVGKKFEEGEFQLDVKESFFSGEDMKKEEAEELLKSLLAEDSTFNIVGEESVSTAKKAGIITDSHIKKISGIPFALILG